MKILFVTRYFPPNDRGWGYMQLCEEVADGLCARGHDIAVLTTKRILGEEITRPYPVHRALDVDPDWDSRLPAAAQFFLHRRRREAAAIASMRQLVERFNPDVVFAWQITGIPRGLLWQAEGLQSSQAVYYMAGYDAAVADEYTHYWNSPARTPLVAIVKEPLSRLALKLMKREGNPISLRFDNSICVSNYVLERLVIEGVIPQGSVVIRNGINLEEFSPNDSNLRSNGRSGLRCLIAGRVVRDKGIHTVIEAISKINRENPAGPVTLTVLGAGDGKYIQHLQVLTRRMGVGRRVHFLAPVDRSEMPSVLAEHDCLIIASEYEEPLARSMVEAMAMGLFVIGTNVGGTPELLVHGKTGLIFEPEDYEFLAKLLAEATHRKVWVQKIAIKGQEIARQRYDIRSTVEQIEDYLGSIRRSSDIGQVRGATHSINIRSYVNQRAFLRGLRNLQR